MIELEGVCKSYEADTFAVHDVAFRVPAGTFVAIVGGSGSGKTTTLKMINRLVEPDQGSIRVGGQRIDEQAPHLLRRRIGYVFQGIGLFPHLTVAGNIGITPRLLGWSEAAIAARTAELLTMVDLPQQFGTRLPSALSGGQSQRVGVARALAARPEILLMDEPFGALDPLTRDALGTSYRRLHDQMRLTTLMVTHDVFEAVLLADRIIVMRAGRIVADGTPRQLMSDHADPEVHALMDMPRRQASRVNALLQQA